MRGARRVRGRYPPANRGGDESRTRRQSGSAAQVQHREGVAGRFPNKLETAKKAISRPESHGTLRIIVVLLFLVDTDRSRLRSSRRSQNRDPKFVVRSGLPPVWQCPPPLRQGDFPRMTGADCSDDIFHRASKSAAPRNARRSHGSDQPAILRARLKRMPTWCAIAREAVLVGSARTKSDLCRCNKGFQTHVPTRLREQTSPKPAPQSLAQALRAKLPVA